MRLTDEQIAKLDYNKAFQEGRKQEQERILEIINGLNSYETALLRIHNTHKQINWACLFLIRLKHELTAQIKKEMK
jgi:hypothetical protein